LALDDFPPDPPFLLVPEQVHEIGRGLAIVDGKLRIKADLVRIVALTAARGWIVFG
jgi:hypothetical protein